MRQCGVNDQDTAELVSRMIGECTVDVRSVGVNSGATAVLAHHENTGVGEAGRRLMQASEVLRMGSDEALVFMRGLSAPIRARRLRYFEEAMFVGLWDRWRDARTAATVHLLLEHKALRIEEKPLRLEHKS